MRVVPFYEKKQRGCQYCADMGVIRNGKEWRSGCPHDECPYHVLDKYEPYEDFMESEDSKILVNEFFTSTADCYVLAKCSNSPKKVFSDGDDRTVL